MTPTITQHVIPRHHHGFSLPKLPSRRRWQRGSINSTTVSITLGVTIIAAVAALSFFYLGQVQHTAGRGTDIQLMEEKLIELRERQKSLELDGAELRSIKTIEQRVPELNLVVSDKVTYLTTPGDRVATRAQ